MDRSSIEKMYIKRNDRTILSSDDERLITAIYNLRKNYASDLEKRHSTILIDAKDVRIAPIIKKNETKNEKVTKSKIKDSNQTVQYCQATKMDGNQCTAKAKTGCVFCGRHLPKEK